MIYDEDNHCDLSPKLSPNPSCFSSELELDIYVGAWNILSLLLIYTLTLAFSVDFVEEEESSQDPCVWLGK